MDENKKIVILGKEKCMFCIVINKGVFIGYDRIFLLIVRLVYFYIY